MSIEPVAPVAGDAAIRMRPSPPGRPGVRRRASLLVALSLVGAAVLAGCGGGGEDPAPAPAPPPLNGKWAGTWRDGLMVLSLSQSGSSVTGSIALGSRTYALAGSYAADTGAMSFRSDARSDCGRYSGSLTLSRAQDRLTGTVTLTVPTTCPPTGSRSLVSSGTTSLARQ